MLISSLKHSRWSCLLAVVFIALTVTDSRGPQTRLANAAPVSPLRIERINIKGRKSGGILVRVRLSDVRFKVALARDQIGATEPLDSMARRYGAIAAINGSYFQAYNSGSYKPPVMNLISDGRLFRQGDIGTMIGFAPDNHVLMERAPQVADQWRSPAGGEWSSVREAVGCGPRLVQNGQIVLNARAEGFNDPKVLKLSTARSAVGVTRDGELLLVASSGTMGQMASLMQSLGCQDAMNLDGGASSGLWTSSRSLRPAGRSLSNALLVLPR